MVEIVQCVTCSKEMYADECGLSALGPACARCLLPHIFSTVEEVVS